jgi:hypothetical protein
MFILIFYQLIFLALLAITKGQEYKLELLGIEPNAGPDSGETRVLVRFKDIDREIIEQYPHPKVLVLFT